MENEKWDPPSLVDAMNRALDQHEEYADDPDGQFVTYPLGPNAIRVPIDELDEEELERDTQRAYEAGDQP